MNKVKNHFPNLFIDSEKAPSVVLLLLFLLALFLRSYKLGTIFESSDSAFLAFLIMTNKGWLWVGKHLYGPVTPIIVKAFVLLASTLNIKITEFWWKFPIALIGSLQVFTTYVLAKQVSDNRNAALFSAAIVAVLPIHVMQSRYLWGYEIIGTFFASLSIIYFIKYFSHQKLRSALLASLFLAIYLMSHGMSLGLIPLIFWVGLAIASEKNHTYSDCIAKVIKLMIRPEIILFPAMAIVVLLAFYSKFGSESMIGHTLVKETRFGIYFQDHWRGFVQNVGLYWFLAIAGSLIPGLWSTIKIEKSSILFLWGLIYLAPIFFYVPPGVTLVRGYMLQGTFALSVYASIFLYKYLSAESTNKKKSNFWQYVKSLSLLVIFILTLAVTISSLFLKDAFSSVLFSKAERGAPISDPGYKAAGYYVRRYVPRDSVILPFAHGGGGIEPPVLYYYFNRNGISFFDKSLDDMLSSFGRLKDKIDVVVVEDRDRQYFDKKPELEIKATVLRAKKIVLLIYGKPYLDLPRMKLDLEKYNKLYDKLYSWQPQQ